MTNKWKHPAPPHDFEVGDLVVESGYDFGRGCGVVVDLANTSPHFAGGTYRMGTIQIFWTGDEYESAGMDGKDPGVYWALPHKIKKLIKAEEQNDG